MRPKTRAFTLAACLGLSLAVALCPAQGGQNSDLRNASTRIRIINDLLGRYLNGDEIQSVLSPGEFSTFPLDLKAGEVVVSEARSEAFDPALQIVDAKNNVLAYNDDRYPGDQRPLLFWRCDHDGAYSLRVKCFHDKSGGSFFFRYNLYNTVDAIPGQKVEKEIDAHAPILLRVPLKKGQNVVPVVETGGSKHYLELQYNAWISSIGLPNYWLPTNGLQPAMYSFVAPVDGDYYEMLSPAGTDNARGTISVTMRETDAQPLNLNGLTAEAKAPTGVQSLWEMKVKKGDLVQLDTPELSPNCRVRVQEAPDFGGCDLSKPEMNPFFPQFKMPEDKGAATVELVKRPNDYRLMVFHAWRDASIWVASNGDGPKVKEFTLKVSPAAIAFPENRTSSGQLALDNSDYWAFSANAGDVLTLSTKAGQFSQETQVYEPDMGEIRHQRAGLDQTSDTWRMVAQHPGQYLLHVSCVGNGGSGPYSVSRQVIHAKDIGLSTPVRGDIRAQEVQVWRFTVAEGAPLLLHWSSNNWNYDVNIYKADGSPTDFQRDSVDDHNKLGILRTPGTYLVVLSGRDNSSYSIDLNPIPGFKKTK